MPVITTRQLVLRTTLIHYSKFGSSRKKLLLARVLSPGEPACETTARESADYRHSPIGGAIFPSEYKNKTFSSDTRPGMPPEVNMEAWVARVQHLCVIVALYAQIF